MIEKEVPVRAQWQHKLDALLPLYGHRNWIVVADSAYPSQTKPGIETIVSGAEQLDVVRTVLNAVNASPHVRANVMLDKELEYVAEQDAKGVSAYRKELYAALLGADPVKMLHEQIIHNLDGTSQVFSVLIIKTTMTIPYTSVFFQLDCGYWGADAERRLRNTMNAAGV